MRHLLHPRRDIETSPPRAPSFVADEQEARAIELETIGWTNKAHRVRTCAAPGPLHACRCKQRVCPLCALNTSERYAQRLLHRSSRMTDPMVVLVTCPSTGICRLDRAFSSFRRALVLLRRRKCFRSVTSGAGALEPRLSSDGMRWSLHAHLAVDRAGAELDNDAIADAWRKLTRGRGAWLVEQDDRLRSPQRFALYASKRDSWCPDPETMSVGALEQLFAGTKGRQLVIDWGQPHAQRASEQPIAGAGIASHRL